MLGARLAAAVAGGGVGLTVRASCAKATAARVTEAQSAPIRRLLEVDMMYEVDPVCTAKELKAGTRPARKKLGHRGFTEDKEQTKARRDLGWKCQAWTAKRLRNADSGRRVLPILTIVRR